jgi:hypothetical protein
MRKPLAALTSLLLPAAMAAAVIVAAPQSASATTTAYTLTYATLPNGAKVPVRWNGCQADITYKVNLGAVPTSLRATVLAETRAAVGQLAAYTRFTFSYKGATTEVPRVGSSPRQTAELIIAFTTAAQTSYNLAGSIVGEGGLYYAWVSRTVNGATSYTVAAQRGFVVIDTPDMLRRLSGGFGAGARRTNLVLHELGHAVGLEHVSDVHQQMYPALSSSSPAGYAAGDRAGLARIGRGAGCINTASMPLKDLS